MVKGINKRVIVVKAPDPRLFEQAIFIMREDAFAEGVSAEQVLDNYDKEENMGVGVPPKGKYMFGMVKVGDKGQIVIPAKARKIFNIKPGDNLVILGDENAGLAILKEEDLLAMMQPAK